MKITTVSVQVGRKISQNYNSVQNSVGLTADLEEGEDHQSAVERLQRECLRLLLKERSPQGLRTDENNGSEQHAENR